MTDNNRLQRMSDQGWKFVQLSSCWLGHDEEIWRNKNFPGLSLRKTCGGEWMFEFSSDDE